ncbi:hypothetical protein TRIP_E280334 [uncultured Spirochaetota bacterium]|nr:hypothetical protein TRIP_E280334 [uncultured Spirochaetota bacterium]
MHGASAELDASKLSDSIIGPQCDEQGRIVYSEMHSSVSVSLGVLGPSFYLDIDSVKGVAPSGFQTIVLLIYSWPPVEPHV